MQESELKPETYYKGNLRLKAKSIERAIDVEKSDVIFQAQGKFDEYPTLSLSGNI